jgi:FKBP-type peptidyl-prolyl cis-trans isomerase FklB
MGAPDGGVMVHEGSGYVLYYQASLDERSRVVRLRSGGQRGGKGIARILRRRGGDVPFPSEEKVLPWVRYEREGFAAHQTTSPRKDQHLKSVSAVLVALALLAPGAGARQKQALKTQKQKTSYSLGLDIGKSLKKQSIDVDENLFIQGIKDALADRKQLLSDDEAREVLNAFQRDFVAKRTEEARKAGEKNMKEGEEFLANNKTKPGVVTLPSGLQYKILKEGNGRTPKATDTVMTNYRGTLINGKEFDSSYKRGRPATFAVNEVIRGWTEALQLMKVGSKWQLFVPSDLAYGPNGRGADIGPNAALIFEIELVGIK